MLVFKNLLYIVLHEKELCFICNKINEKYNSIKNSVQHKFARYEMLSSLLIVDLIKQFVRFSSVDDVERRSIVHSAGLTEKNNRGI